MKNTIKFALCLLTLPLGIAQAGDDLFKTDDINFTEQVEFTDAESINEFLEVPFSASSGSFSQQEDPTVAPVESNNLKKLLLLLVAAGATYTGYKLYKCYTATKNNQNTEDDATEK